MQNVARDSYPSLWDHITSGQGLYLITGLKIARGVNFTQEVGGSRGKKVKTKSAGQTINGAPAVPDAIANDFVFAIQVQRIEKRWVMNPSEEQAHSKPVKAKKGGVNGRERLSKEEIAPLEAEQHQMEEMFRKELAELQEEMEKERNRIQESNQKLQQEQHWSEQFHQGAMYCDESGEPLELEDYRPENPPQSPLQIGPDAQPTLQSMEPPPSPSTGSSLMCGCFSRGPKETAEGQEARLEMELLDKTLSMYLTDD